MCFCIKIIFIWSYSLPDDKKDDHEDSDEKLHALGFDQAAESMIKKVKDALANGEGCRVFCFT